MNKKYSLERLLIIPIALLAVLAITAAVVGWVSGDLVKTAQEEAIDDAVPLLNTARKISFNLSSINSLSPQLIDHTRHVQVTQTHTLISGNIRQITDSIDSVDKKYMLESNSIQKQDIEEIARLVDDLTGLVLERIDASIRLQVAADEMASMGISIGRIVNPFSIDLTDVSLDIADAIYEDLEDHQTENIESRLDALIDVQLQIDSIRTFDSNVLQLNSLRVGLLDAKTEVAVVEFQQKMELIVRSMIDESLRIDNPIIAKKILAPLNELFLLLQDDGPVSESAISYLSQSEAIKDAYERLQQKSSVVSAKITRMEKNTNSVLLQTSAYAKKITQYSEIVLFFVVIASIGLSIYIMRRRLISAVVRPVTELTDSVDAISKNKFDTPIRDYPIIELSKMSSSLSIFRDNAIKLEESQHQLSEKNKLLISTNADLNTFVRVASHDLKSPLRGVSILSEFVREDVKNADWDALESHLQNMQTRVTRMDNLLDSLLRYARTGNSPDALEIVDSHMIVTDAFGLQGGKRGFQLRIESELPTFTTLQAALSVVFRNLFDNAIKHHDKNTGIICVNCETEPEHYKFTVSDDGLGIEPAYHEKVFEAFQTLKSRDEIEGSGIGLSEVKKIIEGLGGSIQINSNAPIERGCTFSFLWPTIIKDHK